MVVEIGRDVKRVRKDNYIRGKFNWNIPGIMSKNKDISLVLVGFGKFDLNDMLKWRGSDKEEDLLMAPLNYPPRYREEKSCSQDQLEDFAEYVNWASKVLKEKS